MAAKPPRPAAVPNVSDALAVMQLARARGRGRKSPLYLWFIKNHDALAVAFAENAPAWKDLASYLASQGLKDGNGNAPQARGTRDVWFRVRQEIKNRLARQAPTLGDAKPGEIARGIAAAPVAPDQPARFAAADADTPSDDYETPRPKTKLVLEPARPRIHPKKEG